MEYPIISEGREAGRLTVSRDGLYTVFHGVLSASQELTRLYLIGDSVLCLGLMEPRAEGRYLYRRLSNRSVPKNIRYCSTEKPAQEKPGAERSRVPNRAEKADSMAGAGRGQRCRSGVTAWPWHKNPDGSLYDPARRILALPARLRKPHPGLPLVKILDKEYLLFRY